MTPASCVNTRFASAFCVIGETVNVNLSLSIRDVRANVSERRDRRAQLPFFHLHLIHRPDLFGCVVNVAGVAQVHHRSLHIEQLRSGSIHVRVVKYRDEAQEDMLHIVAHIDVIPSEA